MNVEIRYSAEGHPYLCFKHATQLAMQNIDITVDAEYQGDDYDSSYDLRVSVCSLCQKEHSQK